MQKLRLWFFAISCLLACATAQTRAEDAAAVVAATEPAGEAGTEAAAAPETPATEAVSETPTAEVAPAVEGVAEVPAAPIHSAAKAAGPARVKVIPIRDAIGKPILYVLRRGLKEAQAEKMQAVVLDMETPGGELGVTLEIMEALDKFDGETLVYVNAEATSAGAIIASVADEIYFAPRGTIGAAEVVMGGGQDVPEAMKRKVNSFMNAKIRAYNEGEATFRAEVIKAMMDAEHEFKVGETVIKPKGELLSLTATEAAKTYGEPAKPLLSAGTHDTVEALLAAKYGADGYTMSRVEVTWSEKLASWLSTISPLLMGAGLLCIFVELKTPGFGFFGIAGGLLVALVFFGHYAAGLSGHEPALVFFLGVALVAVELFLIPGTFVAGIAGVALMLGALAWSMIDVWPNEMPKFDAETLTQPLVNTSLAVVIAAVGGVALARFLPRGWFWDKLVLQAAVGDGSASDGLDAAEAAAPEGGDGLLGASGVAVSAMRPMGEVEVAGRRHEARADLGSLERGEKVRVVGRSGRVLIVARDVA